VRLLWRLLRCLLLRLLLLLLFCQVVTDHASGRGAKHRMVASDVSSDRSNGRTLHAALGLDCGGGDE
jgi:hypothetical protein